LRAGERSVSLTVSGIIASGGAEDSQIVTSLDIARILRFARPRESHQLSVSGTPAEIETFTSHLAAALPGLESSPGAPARGR